MSASHHKWHERNNGTHPLPPFQELSTEQDPSIQTSLPSPFLPHATHSHFIISVSKEAIFTTFFIGLFLLKSKVMEESSALYLWDHHTPNPDKHWTLHVYIYSGHALAKPVWKPKVCRSPASGSSQLTLSTSYSAPSKECTSFILAFKSSFSKVNLNRSWSQCLHNADY